MIAETKIDLIDHSSLDGADLFPDAPRSELERIATAAQARAIQAEADFADDPDAAYSAAQGSYGAAWDWGADGVMRDGLGNSFVDDDEAPAARVYDCDGNTIDVIR